MTSESNAASDRQGSQPATTASSPPLGRLSLIWTTNSTGHVTPFGSGANGAACCTAASAAAASAGAFHSAEFHNFVSETDPSGWIQTVMLPSTARGAQLALTCCSIAAKYEVHRAGSAATASLIPSRNRLRSKLTVTSTGSATGS